MKKQNLSGRPAYHDDTVIFPGSPMFYKHNAISQKILRKNILKLLIRLASPPSHTDQYACATELPLDKVADCPSVLNKV